MTSHAWFFSQFGLCPRYQLKDVFLALENVVYIERYISLTLKLHPSARHCIIFLSIYVYIPEPVQRIPAFMSCAVITDHSVCLSICLSIYLSIYVYTWASPEDPRFHVLCLHHQIFCISLSIYLSICTYLSQSRGSPLSCPVPSSPDILVIPKIKKESY